MALVNCRECSATISDSAKTCPSCGIRDPGLGTVWRVGGAFSQIVGAFVILFGIFLWALLPFIVALPVIVTGVVLCFFPQFGFGLLAILITYSLLGDLKIILSDIRYSLLGSGYLDVIKYLGVGIAAIGFTYTKYQEAQNVDAVSCVNEKKSLASSSFSFKGTFQELASKIRSLQDGLKADLVMVDGSNRLIVLSGRPTLFWFDFVYAVRIDQNDIVTVEIYPKLGDKDGLLFAKTSLNKFINRLHSE